jgi:FixJ family two-component response regulator
MKTETTTVYVVDDDEAVRDSITALVRGAGYTVLAFASGEEFLEQVPAHQTGCLLLDVRMPGIGGMELHHELNQRCSSLSIVFISGHADVALAVTAIKNGAHDFIEKPFNPNTLLKKIERALAECGERCDDAQRMRGVQDRLARLTAREAEVLDRVVAGDSNKTSAIRLGISQKTVETHRFRIMKKMEAKNLPELVQMVMFARGKAAH